MRALGLERYVTVTSWRSRVSAGPRRACALALAANSGARPVPVEAPSWRDVAAGKGWQAQITAQRVELEIEAHDGLVRLELVEGGDGRQLLAGRAHHNLFMLRTFGASGA